MLNFDSVLNYLKNGDTTHFKRKDWKDDQNFKNHHIYFDKKLNKIIFSYDAWGTVATCDYKPTTVDMFAFDWEVTGE